MANPQQSEAEQRFDELLRRALATPPISNEEIVRRSKANGLGERSRKGPKGAARDD